MARSYQFGEFEVLPDERRLIGRGKGIVLGARAFDTLVALIKNRDRIVSKGELLDLVWPGLVVEEANLTVQISALRKILGSQALATITGRGYRFVLPVIEGAESDSQVAAQAAGVDKFAVVPYIIGPRKALPDRPSVAVLPFTNMTGDPEQDYFADGLAEEIITALSKISDLMIIARNSTFTYKGRDVDVREAARELGVRHVLGGSVRKYAHRFRITVHLIDAMNGAQIWAERYDRSVEDIFSVQDEITLIVATEMQVKLTEGEQARLRYTTTQNVEAWSLWVQGLAQYHRGILTREGMGLALECWERAIRLDPRSASLNAMLGLLRYLDARFGFWDDRETALRKGLAYVETALSIDDENSDAHMAHSLLLLLQGRHVDAVMAARKSLSYGPNSADNAAFASFLFANSGLAHEAVAQMERAMTLCPVFPPFYLGHLGNAYHQAGRIEDALTTFEAYHRASPGRGVSDLVIISEQTGQREKAKAWAEILLQTDPTFTVGAWRKTQFREDEAGILTDARSLRSAGLPE